MAATRKLQGEIDRCLKKVSEGVETFEDIWQKVHNATNTNQKEKYEADLKKEIKKLQRLRDQIKSWIASGEIKDKSTLVETRKLIETQMERFKVVERETKTKAYSKEGLGLATKLDPTTREREELNNWLASTIDQLQIQLDQFESEIELIMAGKKKKLDKEKAERMEVLKVFCSKHKFHLGKLEALMRMLDNLSYMDSEVEKLRDFLSQVKKIKDDIEYYLESSQEPEFEENEYIYDDIDGLEEQQLLIAAAAAAQASAAAAGNFGEGEEEKEQKEQKDEQEKILKKQSSVTTMVTTPPIPSTSSVTMTTTTSQTPPIVVTTTSTTVVASSSSSVSMTTRTSTSTTPPVPVTIVTTTTLPSSPIKSSPITTAAITTTTRDSPVTNKSPPVTMETEQITESQISETIATSASNKNSPETTIEQTKQIEESEQTKSEAVTMVTPPILQNQSSQMESSPITTTAENQQEQQSEESSSPQDSSLTLKSLVQTVIDREGLNTNSAHIPPLLGVAPLGPYPLDSNHQMQLNILDSVFNHMPLAADSERMRMYLPRNPVQTPSYYPQHPLTNSDSLEFFQRLSIETLFFIFYYLEGSKAQYLAAKVLKKQSWRFHTKYMMWFQRHEEPKIINEEYEQGTYIYFDIEKWGQRKKDGFVFEYRYLEDRDLN